MKSIWIDLSVGTELIKLSIEEISRSEYEAAYFLMSPERQKRCNEYLSEGDKKRCIAADMLIRDVLSLRTHIDKKSLRFRKAENGKLYLENLPFYFNVSHSDDMVVLAVNPIKEVGVDVEKIRKISANVIRRVCNGDEIEFIFGKDKEPKDLTGNSAEAERFFKIWTYKEALLKCTGEGIVKELDTVNYDADKCFTVTDNGYCITVITAT